MTALILVSALCCIVLWALFLLGLHLLFTRLPRPRLAAGAVYRVRRHTHRMGALSSIPSGES